MSNLTDLMSKYRRLGRAQGANSFVLSPVLAVELAEKLAEIGVGILGVELWYLTSKDGQEYLTEDPAGPDFSELLKQGDFVSQSLQATRAYLETRLPLKVRYVSLVVASDEPYWQQWNSSESAVARKAG